MKKKTLTYLITVLTLFCLIFVVSAETNKSPLFSPPIQSDNITPVVTFISEKDLSVDKRTQEKIISLANEYSDLLLATPLSKELSLSSEKILEQMDLTINEEFYEIQSVQHSIALTKDLTLRAFTDNTFNYDIPTSTDVLSAKSFITDTLSKLNLTTEYSLVNLEKFGDNLWEAVFATKIDGLINYYDSVKIYFCPLQKKIAALRVHSSKYVANDFSSRDTSISEKDAQAIVVTTFTDVSQENIISITPVLTKPNNFFTRKNGEDILTENKVTKAWCVTLKNDTTCLVYIDCITGNIIGGDCIK